MRCCLGARSRRCARRSATASGIASIRSRRCSAGAVPHRRHGLRRREPPRSDHRADLPGFDDWESYEQDPVDYVLTNNLVLVAGLVVLGVLLLLFAIFWLSWRFHTFRITGDDVEVRSGVFFRTHRRAPLDRVQGVNLTRPMVARLLGTAKLEVVGAGLTPT